MITYKHDDILAADAEALVNTVNCVGVMGRGIALQFKKRFPENFKDYESACKRHEVMPGKMYVHLRAGMSNPRYIINFPTKRHWRFPSRLEDIEAGLVSLKETIVQRGIKSIAIPPLGCGLGGLDWTVVRAKIVLALQELSGVEVMIYEPGNGSETLQKFQECGSTPEMTPGRAALIELMQHYLRGMLDPCVTLLEVHKLLYFLQECGEPLRLSYIKWTYGPYSTNLRHVMNRIEGHLISGYADGGDAPQKQLQIIPGAEKKTMSFLKDHPETEERIQKVGELVDGFESSFGLELLATVHWLIVKENIRTLDMIVKHTHSWNERKRQFSARQIEKAVCRLLDKGWIGHIEGIACG